jgi:hypothetical protein
MSEPPIRAEAAARLARGFATASVEQSGRVRAVVARIGTAGRAEARAAAARLDAIAELFALRMAEFGERAEWASDTTDVVASEVAAELRLSQWAARSQLRYARAMAERLPRVAEVFRAGDIDFRMFQTVVLRTDLITDELVLSFVDAELSYAVGSWSALTRGRLISKVDSVVASADRDAVRRRRDGATQRGIWVADGPDGLSEVSGTVFSTAAHAFDKRLSALSHTVCDQDGRSLDERRADALLALVSGTDRLVCRCGRPECPAAGLAGVSAAVIHVIAEQASIDGRGEAPGYDLGSGALIPPELLAQLATEARLRPLIHPGDTGPEDRYTPSRGLAEFVRARDLTCRAPGCDKPAVNCDIDHTIPYDAGGATHASNLKCLCRQHHLLKTFWGWHDEQLRDGTVIWTSPAGEKYLTTPGSASLFGSLCLPTGVLPAPAPTQSESAERTVMMPRRRRTREQERARRVTAERRANQDARCEYRGKPRPRSNIQDPDPPPF